VHRFQATAALALLIVTWPGNALCAAPRRRSAGGTMTGPLKRSSAGLRAGSDELVVSGGNLGVGKTKPTYRLHLTTNATNGWMALEKPGVQTWRFSYTDRAAIGSVPTLQIAPKGSPLNLFLPDEPGGLRMYLWKPDRTVPNLPHTGIKPTFAVFGDMLVGDIISIEKNPMTLFMRHQTGLRATAVTQFFSARTNVGDTDGGAAIVMAPDEPGPVDSGYINLVAYGQGTGSFANGIRFLTRSGPNAVADRMIVKGDGRVGIGTVSPAGMLDVNGRILQRGAVLHADYVFEPDYPLESIGEHARRMWRERHLPAVSPRRVDGQGREVVDLGLQQRETLEELEKAHIYIERLSRRLSVLEKEMHALKRERSNTTPKPRRPPVVTAEK